MKTSKTLQGQNHEGFKLIWAKWYSYGGAQKLPPKPWSQVIIK